MKYTDYKRIKIGNSCSVGTFDENIYAFEFYTGFADVPVYVQITKKEFENFNGDNIYGKRRALCSGYKENGEINPLLILTDEEIEIKKQDKTLFKSGVYSNDEYDGNGFVVINYTSYKLTKQAYIDTPSDTSLLSGFKTLRQGYLWKLAYEEIIEKKHKQGTYLNTKTCPCCSNVSYFNDINIPSGIKFDSRCEKCGSFVMFRKA